MVDKQNPYRSPAGTLTRDEGSDRAHHAKVRPFFRVISAFIGVATIAIFTQTTFDFIDTEYFWRFLLMAIWYIFVGAYSLWVAFTGSRSIFQRS